ncbi:MAG TPA: SDR family NAD(P)-dependent oxidoreductase [Thermoleophilaceae bacterium]|nr:SDR family NAD(P)-dependent oxidoreductase [Thermoleophilaceae bacterium]
MKVAVVTGASSGIGLATARLLAARGWRQILVARRAERLEALAAELPQAVPLALDLTAGDAPGRVREAVEREGALHLLVNNAGAGMRAPFAESGYETVRRLMEVNFDAIVRLTEVLLPLLRESAPSSIVNVGSVAGRVGRPKVSAYAASKFALAGWSEALHYEEAPNGVHVGLVMPGFVATEGFPQTHLVRSPRTRWMVSTPEKVARAILGAGPGGRAEVHVPRPWALVPRARFLAPGLVRRVVRRGRL